jgi:oligopeptide transport system substrate-binding protein
MKLTGAVTGLLVLCAGMLALAIAPGCGGRPADTSQGNVLYLHETGDPRSIDPHKAGDVVSSQQCGMVYETLYQYDYLARPAKLIPCLAEGDPEYDADTLTYTFRLRRDVFFQDNRCFHPSARGRYFEQESPVERADVAAGRQLTAHDIEYSLKRLAALPDSGGYWVLEGKIEGLDEFREEVTKLKGDSWQEDAEFFAAFDRPVSGIKILDDFTLQVKLREPYPQFLYAITLSYGAAVAREAAEYYGDQLTRNPVGTGPYRLENWWEQKELVWVRNPNFRDEFFPTSDAPEDELWHPLGGKKLPLCDKVVFRIIKEAQPSFLEFLNGTLAASGMDKDQFTQAMTSQTELTEEYKAKGIRLRAYEEPTIHYISFNMNDSIVGTPAGEKGRARRRALAHAFNRADYIGRMLNGRGSPAGQITPPGMVGHFDDYYMPSQRYDLDQARQVLRDAGYQVTGSGDDWMTVDPDTGRQVTITILHRSTRDSTKDYAVMLKNMGRRIGINIENDLMTFAEFLQRQDEGTGQAYDAGWVMDYPDAQNMLQLLYGPNKPPGINSASFANDEYDRLYREMAVLDQEEPDQRERKLELIRRMNDILDREVPWVLVEFRKILSLYHHWFYPAKWEPANAFAYTYIKYYYVDPEAAAQIEERESPFLPGFLLLCLVLIPAGLMGLRVLRNQM